MYSSSIIEWEKEEVENASSNLMYFINHCKWATYILNVMHDNKSFLGIHRSMCVPNVSLHIMLEVNHSFCSLHVTWEENRLIRWSNYCAITAFNHIKTTGSIINCLCTCTLWTSSVKFEKKIYKDNLINVKNWRFIY